MRALKPGSFLPYPPVHPAEHQKCIAIDEQIPVVDKARDLIDLNDWLIFKKMILNIFIF